MAQGCTPYAEGECARRRGAPWRLKRLHALHRRAAEGSCAARKAGRTPRRGTPRGCSGGRAPRHGMGHAYSSDRRGAGEPTRVRGPGTCGAAQIQRKTGWERSPKGFWRNITKAKVGLNLQFIRDWTIKACIHNGTRTRRGTFGRAEGGYRAAFGVRWSGKRGLRGIGL